MTLNELETLSNLPLFELLKQSRAVHEAHWEKQEVQLCTLLSIKTGGCSEDCSYCAQSARYSTGVDAERLMSKEAVMENAHAAKANGSTRFCMGAAWKGVRQGTKRFDEVLDIIRGVSELDMEVCVTLGEVGAEEAQQLAGIADILFRLGGVFFPGLVKSQDPVGQVAALHPAQLVVVAVDVFTGIEAARRDHPEVAVAVPVQGVDEFSGGAVFLP